MPTLRLNIYIRLPFCEDSLFLSLDCPDSLCTLVDGTQMSDMVILDILYLKLLKYMYI